MKNILQQQINRMIEEMQLKGFSRVTINTYSKNINRVHEFFQKPLLDLTSEEVRNFFLFLLNVRKLSTSSWSNAYYSLNFFFTLFNCIGKLSLVPKIKRSYELPQVFSRSEIETILNHISSLKYRAIYFTIYGAGLRISELGNLKISDIDLDRMQIRVQGGKGNKDRYTLLSKRNMQVIIKYIEYYKPNEWLFYAKSNRSKNLDTRQIQRYFSEIIKKLKIDKRVSVHTLRHSFATHLLEDGTNIFYIQRLLGHANISSTSRYLHMQDLTLLNITSPLDSNKHKINNLEKIEPVQQWIDFKIA
jgi:site-specific recombinase XerD